MNIFKRILSFLYVLVSVAFPLLAPSIASAVADTCTWTGAVNANWSNGANWSGCDNGGVPENGDTLVFPEIASNKATNNDFPAGVFQKIDITGSGYTIGGTDLTLNGTIALTASQSATINLDITYSAFNINIATETGTTLTLNNGTWLASAGGETNIGLSGFDGTVNFVGAIAGDAGNQFIAVSGATAQLRSPADNFSATTIGAESNGIFECYTVACFGNNTNDIYSGGGIVKIYQTGIYPNNVQTSAVTPDNSWLLGYDDISITGNMTVTDPLGVSQETDNKSLQFTGSVVLNGPISVFGSSTLANIHFDGAVSGASGFSFGSGTAYMSGSNTYDGANTVNSGAIAIVEVVSGLGSNSGMTNVLSGGSLRFDFGALATVDEPLQIAGSGIAGEGALVQTQETVILSGAIALDGNTTVGVATGALSSRFELSGVISGTGDITVTASPSTSYVDSSIQFTGPSANTYVGKLVVDAVRFYPSKANNVVAVTGDIEVNASATKDAQVETSFDESIADSSHITLTNNGSNKAYLNIGTSAYETIGYVTGDGEVSLGSIAGLALSYVGNYTFNGDVSKFANFPAGNSTIYKQGAGIATFTGGINTIYFPSEVPSFQVDGGYLVTNSTFTDMPVIVASGTTLKGSGSVGYVTVNPGGAINVGNSPGCMTVATLDMSAGSTFTEEIAGGTACTQYDQTTVTGSADLNNATLSIIPSYTPTIGTVFTIINAGSVNGTFNGLSDGATLTVSGVQYRINYTSSKVTLTVVSSTPANTTTASSLLSNTGIGVLLSIISGTMISVITLSARRKTSKQ